MNSEQTDHYSNVNNHWCIIMYSNSTPFYYTGWFGKNDTDTTLKPAISIDFNQALKLHSKIAAEIVLRGLKSCSHAENFIIQDHAYM